MHSFNRYILNADTNPLRRLPPVQRFQIMSYLGMMWTAIFCAGTGAWIWLGELVVFHILIAAGFAATGWVFAAAGNLRLLPSRNLPHAHGTLLP